MVTNYILFSFCCVALHLVQSSHYESAKSEYYFNPNHYQNNWQPIENNLQSFPSNDVQSIQNDFPSTQNFQSPQNYQSPQNFQSPQNDVFTGAESIEQKYFNLFTSNTQDKNQNIFNDYLNHYESSLSYISTMCPSDSFFSNYNPSHKAAVSSVIDMYKDLTDIEEFVDMSEFLKSRPEIHPQVWYTGLVRAQSARIPRSLSMPRPSLMNLFPSNFFADIAMQQSTSPQDCVFVDESIGEDNGVENLLWYFREDVQMNAHHWIWHLIYPVNGSQPIDRRGEFFYFFHHELLARYATERICNGLPEQPALDIEVNTVIPESYNPHLRDGVSSSNWAPRPPYSEFLSSLSLVNASYVDYLYSLVEYKNRFLESIVTGSVFRGDISIPIHTVDNINLIGEIAEASNYSLNPQFYGMDGYHSQGHLLIANLVGNAPRGEIGVMGHNGAAMRDPIFYRWHKYVDLLFLAYKTSHLAPYLLNEGVHPLVVDGVRITDLKVIPDHSQRNINKLHTFWNSRTFFLDGGLDYNVHNRTFPRDVNVCAKHLDHEEFTYRIKIENNRHTQTSATVRIFLAPRFKSVNGQERFTVSEQRNIFFTMDSFPIILKPGPNVINRRSEDSTVSAPWPKSIEQIRQEIVAGIRSSTDCECGYPHHLLLPKGTEKGMVFDLFVIVTDGASDQVVDFPGFSTYQEIPTVEQCVPSHVHCGIPGRSYPDAKPMGYPFDRRPFNMPTLKGYEKEQSVVENREVATIEEYVSFVPNSATTQIMITHQNVQRGFESDIQV